MKTIFVLLVLWPLAIAAFCWFWARHQAKRKALHDLMLQRLREVTR
jgi:preprotein translocase subunit YajC